MANARVVEENIVDRFVRDIVAAVQPLRIIIFGSWARDEQREASDIDLLVVMPEGTNRREVAGKLYREIPRHGTAMDVIVATPRDLERYRDNPGLIYKRILEEGQEVYAA